jgi:hypothetical protein
LGQPYRQIVCTHGTVLNGKKAAESGTLFDEVTMPGAGGHRFYFVGREPLVLRVVATLFVVNTFLFLSLDFGAKYLLPKASLDLEPCEALTSGGVQYHAPEIVCWYASRSIAIQFILLAFVAAIFIIFRKQVQYIPPKYK